MMLRHTVSAAAALAMTAFATQAMADAPCGKPPCGVRPVAVYKTYEVPRFRVVDRGPVYAGPGIYVWPTVVWRQKLPRYPYVGRIYPGF